MNPLIIQAIAADQVRAMHEQAAARQRAAESRRAGAGRRSWLRRPGPERGLASRAARRAWRDPRAA